MVGDQVNLIVDEILKDAILSEDILNIAGKRFVIDHIKRSIRNYAEAYNLNGVTIHIKKSCNKK